MRRFTLGWVFSVAVLLPNVGTAQVYMRPNPYPQVTAANAAWQLRGDPVFHAGAFYYPAGPSIFFDGNVMNRTDTYQGVPVYEDATLTPFSIVYIPIGGNVVRPYERRREGDVAGTTASRTPSFPIQRDGEVLLTTPNQGVGFITYPPIDQSEPVVVPEAAQFNAAVRALPPPPTPEAFRIPPAPRRFVPTIFQVWVPFEGERWFSAGATVPYSADRFTQVGEHGGFPVYRAKTGSRDQIFIPSVADGPVAPYKKNR